MGIVMRATGTVGALATWHHLRLVRTIFGSRWSPEAHKSTSKMTSEWIRVARIKVASAQVDSALGAGVARYAFTVMDFHHLSPAGLPAHRGSMAGLHDPLPTLRRYPPGGRRPARGPCGSLFLHRISPPTPCQSPGALPQFLVLSVSHADDRR